MFGLLQNVATLNEKCLHDVINTYIYIFKHEFNKRNIHELN